MLSYKYINNFLGVFMAYLAGFIVSTVCYLYVQEKVQHKNKIPFTDILSKIN